MSDAKVEKQHLSGQQATEKLRDLLQHFRSAMFTTGTGGDVRTRPMGIQGKAQEFKGSLWFFTDERSRKVAEIRGGAVTSLLCQSDEADSYLHLRGTASVGRDLAKMKELYTPIIKTWFPEGLDDPFLTLIRFDVDNGDYWTSTGGMLQLLGAFVKATVTGKPGAGGEMGDVTLK